MKKNLFFVFIASLIGSIDLCAQETIVVSYGQNVVQQEMSERMKFMFSDDCGPGTVYFCDGSDTIASIPTSTDEDARVATITFLYASGYHFGVNSKSIRGDLNIPAGELKKIEIMYDKVLFHFKAGYCNNVGIWELPRGTGWAPGEKITEISIIPRSMMDKVTVSDNMGAGCFDWQDMTFYRRKLAAGMKIVIANERVSIYDSSQNLYFSCTHAMIDLMKFCDYWNDESQFHIFSIMDGEVLRVPSRIITGIEISAFGTSVYLYHGMSVFVLDNVYEIYIIGKDDPDPEIVIPDGLNENFRPDNISFSEWTLKVNASDVIRDVKIMNIVGMKVKEEFPSSLSAEINLSSLPQGFYMAIINGSYVYKFMKL